MLNLLRTGDSDEDRELYEFGLRFVDSAGYCVEALRSLQ